MNYFIYLIIFIFGLLIGSFINCLIYRLHLKKTFVHGRSFCPHCQHQLAWYDNLPLISYLLLKAKCRHCKKTISRQYPIVELITGILFLIVFTHQFAQVDFNVLMFSCFHVLMLIRNWLFTAFLIIIFLYDLKYYLILDKVIIPAIVITLIFNIALNIQYQISNIWNYLGGLFLAALIAGGFFLLQFIVSKGKWIGGGDIRLGVLMGLMLGWPNILTALILGYLIGSIIGVGLIIFGKKKLKSQVPLGTFLTVSTFVALLWGLQIIDWYLSIVF